MPDNPADIWGSEPPAGGGSLPLTAGTLKTVEELFGNPWGDQAEGSVTGTSVTMFTPTETAPSEALDSYVDRSMESTGTQEDVEEDAVWRKGPAPSLPSGSLATNETAGSGVPAAPSADRDVQVSRVTKPKTDLSLPPVVLCPSIIQAPDGRHYEKVFCAFPSAVGSSTVISEDKKKAIEEKCFNLSHTWTVQDFDADVGDWFSDPNGNLVSKAGGPLAEFEKRTLESVRAFCREYLDLDNPVTIAEVPENPSVVSNSRILAAETISAWQTRALEAGKNMVEVSVVLPKCGVTSCQVESDLDWKCLNPKEDETGRTRTQRFSEQERRARRAQQGV